MDEDKNQTYEEVTCIGVLGGWYPTVPYCLACKYLENKCKCTAIVFFL